MIQFEMPRQQRYQLVADDESDMPEWAEEYTICNLRSGPDPGPYMFYGGEWVMLSSYAVRDGTLKIYHDVKAGDQPWDGDASEVREVVVADTVKSIGAGAFTSLGSLEYVSIPAGVEVEEGAFSQTFKDPFDADVAMADVAGYEYVAYEGVMYQCDPEIFTITNGRVSLSSEASGAVNIVITRSIGGVDVDGVYGSGFKSSGVERVIFFGKGFAAIGYQAFHSCTSLTDMVFPEGPVQISTGAFLGANGLQSIVLGEGTTQIDYQAFIACSAAETVYIPDSVTTIGTQAFQGCTGVQTVYVGKGITSLQANSFNSWTFYAADGTTTIDKTVASNLAGKTFKGSASRLVEDAGPQPGMEGRYMYAITTDSAGMNILSVQAAHDGRPLDTIVTASTRRQGAENIPDEWDFVDGVGPFKCWYGAFNIQDYVAGTESEAPVCTGAGMLAYRLDPYDLGTTMQGTELQGTYNVFLVVPTVYWKAVGNILYLSDDSSYAGITGMTAYAHTATLPDTTQSVFQYLGIGVYEAHSEDGDLRSVFGVTPTVNLTCDQFKALCDAMTPAEGSDYQQWNFFQWTLFKMMCYTVMGTKNSQWMMGDGPTQNDPAAPSVTGQADLMGPYAQSTKQYDKVFIENSWGSVWQFLGDVSVNEHQLYAGDTLGGTALGSGGDQPIATGIVLPSENGWVSESYLDGAAWDMTKTVGADHHADPAYLGDYYYQAAGWRCCVVGGRWSTGSDAGVSFVNVSNSLSGRFAYIGARLAYLMAADAAAPAPSRTSLGSADAVATASVKSSGTLQQGREDLAEMVSRAQEEAAQAMAEGLAQPEEDAEDAPADVPAEDGAEETGGAEEGTILI